MRIPGMHYQDASWSELSKQLSAVMAESIIEYGVEKLDTNEAFIAQWPYLWSLIEKKLPRKFSLRKLHNVHGINGVSLALDLLLAIAADNLKSTNGTTRKRDSALLRLAKGMPKYQKNENVKAPKASLKKLKEKCLHVLTEVRDRVDIQGFLAEFGFVDEDGKELKDCEEFFSFFEGKKDKTVKKMTHYYLDQLRQIDTCLGEMGLFFENWQSHPEKLAIILGHEIYPGTAPIEVSKLRKGHCKASWLLTWSKDFATKRDDGLGPLHGSRVSEKNWGMKKLEKNIEDIVDDLRFFASLCNDLTSIHKGEGTNARSSLENEDLGKLIEVRDAVEKKSENRLLEHAPEQELHEYTEVEIDDELGQSECEQEENPEIDPETEDQDEIKNHIDDDTDIESHGSYVEAGHEALELSITEEVESSSVMDECLKKLPLSLQVGVLFEIYPTSSANQLLNLLRRKEIFSKWNLPENLDSVTDTVISKHYLPNIGVEEFEVVVQQAKENFMNCCILGLNNLEKNLKKEAKS